MYLLPMGTLLLNMTQTSQSHRLPFHHALYPVPRGLVARIRAAVAEWLAREPINLDAADHADLLRVRLEALPPSSARSRLLADLDDAETFGYADASWCAARMAEAERMQP